MNMSRVQEHSRKAADCTPLARTRASTNDRNAIPTLRRNRCDKLLNRTVSPINSARRAL